MTDYAGATGSDTEAYGRFARALLDDGVYPPPSQYEAWFVGLDARRRRSSPPPARPSPGPRRRCEGGARRRAAPGRRADRAGAPRRCWRRSSRRRSTADQAVGLDLILEGFLLHHGAPAPPRARPSPGREVLAGDYCYAHGLVRIADVGRPLRDRGPRRPDRPRRRPGRGRRPRGAGAALARHDGGDRRPRRAATRSDMAARFLRRQAARCGPRATAGPWRPSPRGLPPTPGLDGGAAGVKDLREWIARLERERASSRACAAPVDPRLEITEIADRVSKSGGPGAAVRERRRQRAAGADQPVRHASGACAWRSTPRASTRWASGSSRSWTSSRRRAWWPR